MTITRLAERLTIACCSYELLALTTGRVPTVSSFCRKHPAGEIALISALLIDFHLLAKEAAAPPPDRWLEQAVRRLSRQGRLSLP